MAYLSGGSPTVKAITHIPGWALESTSGKVTSAATAYERIPIIRRGVDVLADSLVTVPHRIETTGGAEGKWPFAQDLDSLLAATLKSYLIEGAAYWLKLRNRIKTAGVQWLNPTTMRVEFAGRRPNGTVGLKFTQSADKVLSWDETQIVYFRQWHLRDDITPGKSIVETVLESAGLQYYMTHFAKTFFEHGAQPVVLVVGNGGASDDQFSKVEEFFRRLATGVNNAFRVIGLRNSFDIKIVTPPIDTLAMPELSTYSIRQVAIGMGIPETMLTDAANYATAAQHDTQFWKNTIMPLANMLTSVINAQILEPMGLKLCFYPEEMDVFQEDEEERASSLVSLTNAGFPLDIAGQILGYELPDKMKWEDLIALIEERKPPAPVIIPAPSARQDVTPEDGTDEELRQYRSKVIKRLRDGKPVPAFNAEYIPATLKAAIDGALDGVTAVSEANLIFADALRYP